MISIGTDIVFIPRIHDLIDLKGTKFLNKIFTDDEIHYCNEQANPSMHFSGTDSCSSISVSDCHTFFIVLIVVMMATTGKRSRFRMAHRACDLISSSSAEKLLL